MDFSEFFFSAIFFSEQTAIRCKINSKLGNFLRVSLFFLRICLIRSDSVEEAKEKLRKSISDYSLEKEIEPHFQKRVRIVRSVVFHDDVIVMTSSFVDLWRFGSCSIRAFRKW